MAAKKKQKPKNVRVMINLSVEDYAKLRSSARSSFRSAASEGGRIVSEFLQVS